MRDQTYTTRLTHRKREPVTTTVIWYAATEDSPATSGAVLDEYGRQVYANKHEYGKWYALGVDGGYYEINPPVFWCYIPEPPYMLDYYAKHA